MAAWIAPTHHTLDLLPQTSFNALSSILLYFPSVCRCRRRALLLKRRLELVTNNWLSRLELGSHLQFTLDLFLDQLLLLMLLALV